MRLRLLSLLAVAGVLPLAGCDNSDDGSVPHSLSGTFADDAGRSGTLAIDISDVDSLASSTLRVLGQEGDRDVVMIVHLAGGADTSLAGRFDTGSGVFGVDQSGYRFAGTLSGNRLSGACETPGGHDGVFVAIATDHATVTLYCGHYAGDDEGTLSVAVASTGLALLSATSDGSGPLGIAVGEVDDGHVTFEAGGVTVTGQIAGGTIAGDWHHGSDGGAWAASTGSCD